MKKGTSLFKALLFERRLPWRYKELGFLRGFWYGLKPYNINTKNYWNKKLDKFKKGKWREGGYKNIINHHLSENQSFSLLDIGCALGDGTILIKEKFPKSEISGCDISSVGIKKAKQKHKEIKFFELNILKQNLSKKYDYITMVSIIEHFDEPSFVIDKCLNRVNKALIIDCPYNEKDPSGEHRHSFDENSLSKYKPEHEVYFADQRRITYVIKK